jgi:hypothetical protein
MKIWIKEAVSKSMKKQLEDPFTEEHYFKIKTRNGQSHIGK